MPARICRSMHSSTARSSTCLKAASASFPAANRSRASLRYAGRKRLPTRSLRYTTTSTNGASSKQPGSTTRFDNKVRQQGPTASLLLAVDNEGNEAGITVIQILAGPQVETIVRESGMLRDRWLLFRALLRLL